MQPLHIIFENSRQSGEVPTNKKGENVNLLLKREIRKTKELQATSVPGKVMEQILLENIL